MNELPKVSVAIITYNQEDFIEETLRSVIDQDYPNLEIVISDDGSTDLTPSIIKSYSDLHPSLFKVILSDRNSGIAENCNRAFLSCTGEYIAWLGGDDVFYPGKIRVQVEIMENDKGCDLCYHPVRVFDSQSGKTIEVTNSHDRIKRNLKQLLYDGISLPGSSVMVRRSSCPVNGFNNRIPVANDWLFFAETMFYGYAIRAQDVLGGYRMHSRNVSKNSLIDDMHKTFEHIRYLKPEFKNVANRAEAIAYYHEGRKFINNDDYISARNMFIGGLKVYFLFYPLWIWFALSFLGKPGYYSSKFFYHKFIRCMYRDVK